MPIVTISRRGEERVRGGHPWVYRSDVTEVDAAAGDIVAGHRSRGRGRSATRFSAIDRKLPSGWWRPATSRPATSFWSARLADAIRYRAPLAIDATAYRLVHGEADRLPSLIVDRYGDYLVVQALSQAVDRHLPDITARSSIWRSRRASSRETIRGSVCSKGSSRRSRCSTEPCPTRIDVREGAVRYRVDPWRGQKTGCSSISGRIAKPRRATPAAGCSMRSATTVASRSRSRRSASRCWPSTSPRRPSRVSGRTPRSNGLGQRRGARDERVRRAARARADRRALRHDRARPSRVREEQGVGAQGARRLQGNQPPRARSCSSPAAS